MSTKMSPRSRPGDDVVCSHKVEITEHCTRLGETRAFLYFQQDSEGPFVEVGCEKKIALTRCRYLGISPNRMCLHPGFIVLANELGIDGWLFAKLIVSHTIKRDNLPD